MYQYGFNDPLLYSDPTGLWAGVDDAIFSAGGAAIGVGSLFLSNSLTGNHSSWGDYAGAAIGGAVGGEVLLYTLNPFLSGAAAGLTGNITAQASNVYSGEQCDWDVSSLVADTALGAATGFIPGPKIPGITQGRGSNLSLLRGMVTKFRNGSIKNVQRQTAQKMWKAAATHFNLPAGALIPNVVDDLYGSNF